MAMSSKEKRLRKAKRLGSKYQLTTPRIYPGGITPEQIHESLRQQGFTPTDDRGDAVGVTGGAHAR